MGVEVFFIIWEKEFEIELIKVVGFKCKSFGKYYKIISGKIFGLLKFDLKMILMVL